VSFLQQALSDIVHGNATAINSRVGGLVTDL
jgi:hypothetical protein